MNEYLAHYGVKGMRWGVRKNRRAAKSKIRREYRNNEASAKLAARRKIVDSELKYYKEMYRMMDVTSLGGFLSPGDTKRIMQSYKSTQLGEAYRYIREYSNEKDRLLAEKRNALAKL